MLNTLKEHKKDLSLMLKISVFATIFVALGWVFFKQFSTSSRADTNQELKYVNAYYSIASNADIAQQEGMNSQAIIGDRSTSKPAFYIGNGSSNDSLVGLHFTGARVPPEGVIKYAAITFFSPSGQAVSFKTEIYAEKTYTPTTFSPGENLFNRMNNASSKKIPYILGVNTRPSLKQYQTFGKEIQDPVKEISLLPNRTEVTAINILVKGVGTPGNKAFFAGVESGKYMPMLHVVYQIPVTQSVPATTDMPKELPSAAPTLISSSPTTAPVNVTSTPLPTVSVPAPTYAASADCKRPYSDNSPWNSPIGSNPEVDASANVAALGSTMKSTIDQYTYPVYYVNNSTPLKRVTIRKNYTNVTNNGNSMATGATSVMIPVPDGVVIPIGTDRNILIINTDTGDEYGFWKSEPVSDTDLRWAYQDGTSYYSTNGYHYNINWSSVAPGKFGSRGAGIPYFAGLVRPCEIKQGHIDHALAIAFNNPGAPPLYPATKSDGTDGAKPQEGQRLQLDPTMTQADLAAVGCTGTCYILAKAMQVYGLYVIDISGSTKIYPEYDNTAHWNGMLTSSSASKIPMDRLRGIKPPAQ